MRRALLPALAFALGAAGASAVLAPPAAHAATTYTPGDVVVYRVGAGVSGLTTASTAAFLDEYAPSGGTAVSTVPLPTTASGSNRQLTASGTATSEGLLNLSTDGRYLVATGYAANTGVASIAGTASSTTPRTVGLVSANQTVDSSTALTDYSTGNNPRSAMSTDGTSIWVAGGAGGIRYATKGAATSTQLTTATTNFRGLGIAGGQLYESTQSGTNSVGAVGTGLPMSAATISNLNLTPAPTAPNGFAFIQLAGAPSTAAGSTPDTLYIADNLANVVKYSLISGVWTREGQIAVAGVAGVTATDSNGVVTVYASGPATLVKITDASGIGGSLTGSTTAQVASAPANTAFRGVALAPGSTIGSGGGTLNAAPPTITTARAGLPAALNDTNPTLPIAVADPSGTYTASQLTVTASSSNTAVTGAPAVSGTGTTRTLSVTPLSVGRATITLTVSAPDTRSGTTTVLYGASNDLGNTSDRYLSGAGNASAAVDMGGGYVLVADDENNLLRLYDTSASGPPVKTFDFTTSLPNGATEADFEGMTRVGNTVYVEGSMSNNSDGQIKPARSTLVAATVTGSGASTDLTFVKAYSNLQTDLVSWDQSNGHGLGANYLGFYDSVHGGVQSHDASALNLEGFEFASGSTSTAYLGFRAPLEPTDNRHLALVVPVTNAASLVSPGGDTAATFGAPIFWDLGGYGIRDLKRNANGTFLIIAGSADDSNTSFVLYRWDGVPTDAPVRAGTTLTNLPSDATHGSWETIVSVPSSLTSGSTFQLIADDGTVPWYNDGQTTKSTPALPTDLAKSIERTFTFAAGAPSIPTNVVAQVGDSRVRLDFTPPTAAPAPTSYTVTETVGDHVGQTYPLAAGATGADITGLANGTAYAFTVTAVNDGTSGTPSAASNTVTPRVVAGEYTALTPTRIVDTRLASGPTAGAPVGAGASQELTVPVLGRGGVPASGVSAVVVNLTGVDASDTTYVAALTAPGTGEPSTSNLNFVSNQPKAVQVTVPVNSDGTITVFNKTGTIDVILDVQGFYQDDTALAAGRVHPQAPQRLLDTRDGTGEAGGAAPVGPGQHIDIQVTGQAGVPAGATAVIMNLTGVAPTTSTFVTASSPTGPVPDTSSLNLGRGEVVPNLVTVPLSPAGKMRLTNDSGTIDLVADITGYITSASDATGARYQPATQTRVLDTRTGPGPIGQVSSGQTVETGVNAPAGATGALIGLTSVVPTNATFLAVNPAGSPGLATSTLNSPANAITSNAALTMLGTDATTTQGIAITNAQGNDDILADIQGYLVP